MTSTHAREAGLYCSCSLTAHMRMLHIYSNERDGQALLYLHGVHSRRCDSASFQINLRMLTSVSTTCLPPSACS